MRIAERLNSLPVEDWAAAVARLGRRLRRRVLRRPGAAGVAAAGLCIAIVTASNALWSQSERHPAPFWGGEAEPMIAAHGGRAAPADVPAPVVPPKPRSVDADVQLVETLQKGLADAGYYDGAVSGALDVATRSAISSFEEARGLKVTGEPSLALLAAVNAAPAAKKKAAVLASASAAAVDIAAIQRALNERGFGPLEVDGKLGPMTRDAIGRFAIRARLDWDGRVHPELAAALVGEGA